MSSPHPHAVFAPGDVPRRVYWELTRACSLACRHCRAEAQKSRAPDELTRDEAFAVLRALAAGKPTPVVVLTGGDPLERPDFFEILEYAKRLGLHVDVAPSATPKLTPDVVRRLKTSGVGAMSLSLDGSDPARHDALRGIEGCFDRTLQIAAEIVGAGIPLQINTLVTAETLADLPAIRDRVAEIGAKRWSLFFLVTTGRGALLPQITPEQAEELFAWLTAIGPSSPFVIATTEAPQYRRHLMQKTGKVRVAGAGMRDGNGILFISHRGELMPSGFLPLVAGSTREQDPLAIYRDSTLFKSLRDTASFGGRCGSCESREVCGGSRGRAYAAFSDPLAEDPLCAIQPGR